MEVRKTHRHVMVEKTGYGEPFCKLSRDGVLLVDSGAVDSWKNANSHSEKIKLISAMMERYGVKVVVSPTIYDPQDFTPSFRIIIWHNNQLSSLDGYIRISDFLPTNKRPHHHDYDFDKEQILHENMLYDILRETCQKTVMLNPKF